MLQQLHSWSVSDWLTQIPGAVALNLFLGHGPDRSQLASVKSASVYLDTQNVRVNTQTFGRLSKSQDHLSMTLNCFSGLRIFAFSTAFSAASRVLNVRVVCQKSGPLG